MIPIFLRELEAIFGWLLTASWQASVLALLVLLLQTVLRGRLNPRWRYALWLLVVVRLLLPVLPVSALSLFQVAPQPPPSLVAPVMEPIFAPAVAWPEGDLSPFLPAPGYPFTFYSLLAVAWLAGAVTLLALTFIVNGRFARQVAKAPAITEAGLLELFAATKAELGISRSIRLIESGQVQSPAVMGLFQPTLLLPAHVREKFDARELRFIFLHELAHLKRGDVIVQALIALLQIAHWFNPVLWLAFRRMRIDREPATDAMVLSRAGEEEKERYGLMLIKLLEHFNQRHSLPTLVGILENKDQFKRRFSLIAKFTRGAYGWSLLGIGLISVLAIVGLTRAATNSTIPLGVYTLLPDSEWSIYFENNGNAYYYTGGEAYTTRFTIKDRSIYLTFRDPDGATDILDFDGKRLIGRIGNKFLGDITHQYTRVSDLPGPNGVLSAAMAKEELPDSSKMAAPTSETLAQLVLALHDSAKSIPADRQRLQILKGFYGADGSWRDVTGILQKSIQNNSLKVSWKQPYTEIGGDPAFLQVKTLVVSYRLDGVEKLATFCEENPPVGLQATIPPTPASTSNAPAAAELLTVRTFLLPPNSSLDHGSRSTDSVRAWLAGQGIQFPEGSAVTLIPEIDPDKLVIRNTPEQLDKVNDLIIHDDLISREAQKTPFSPEPAASPMTPVVCESGNSGAALAAPITLAFTLVEVDEKTYAQQAAAMDTAVAKGDRDFFARQKDVFVGPEVKATYSSRKGWYSVGVVQSYVGSVAYDKLNGKTGTILQAEAVFLGINADFAFSTDGTAVDTVWQLTEPEKTVSQKVPPLALAQRLPVTFSLRPMMHVTTFKDKNWVLVPGQVHSYWLGKTLGQLTQTGQFRDLSHASIDEMVKNKVPSRIAVFVTAR